MQRAGKIPPDVVLLDADMPAMNGYQVCEALKKDPLLADIPVSVSVAPILNQEGRCIGVSKTL